MLTRLPWFLPLTIGLHNLSSRLWRTFLTTLGIVLGVAVVLAIEITNTSTLASINQTLNRAIGNAELLVVPKGEEDTFDAEFVTWVEDLPGIQIAAPNIRIRTIATHQIPSTEARLTGKGVEVGRKFEIHGIDPKLDPQVRLYTFSSGRMPAEGNYEILLPQIYAQDHNLNLGDDFELTTPFGLERLEIVGFLSDEGVAALNGGVVGFAPLSVVQQLFDLGDVIQEISIHVQEDLGRDPNRLDTLKEEITERLGDEARAIYPAARGDLVPRMLNAYQIGLSFFSVIAIFVGAFLIYNTFSMSVAERIKEIGMYRAIGMSRSQVLFMIMLESGILGAVGAILGMFTGLWLARSLLIVLGGFLADAAEQIIVTPESMVKSVGVGVSVTLVSALIPAIQAANISPLQALRVRSRTTKRLRPAVWLAGIIMLFSGYSGLYYLKWRQNVQVPAGSTAIFMLIFGAVLILPLLIGLLEHSSRWLTVLLYGNEGRLGSGNVRRSVFRTTLTVACLMVALTMIIGIGSVSYTFEQDIEHWVNSALGGDVFVEGQDTLQSRFLTQLMSVPGVDVISPARFLEVQVAPAMVASSINQRERLVFTAIDPALFRQIGDMVFITGKNNPEENWQSLNENSSIFVSTVLAEEYNLEVGDTLNLMTKRGEHGFRVAALVTDFSNSGYVVTSTYDALKRWFNEDGVNRFTIMVQPGIDPNHVSVEIEDRYQERYNLAIQTAQTIKASVTSLMDKSFQLFDVLTLVGVIIGTLGVVNTLTMNVLERRREIGALRSMGMTRSQVVKMVLAEALAMGMMGCMYGLAFGYLISLTFVHALVVLSSYDIEYLFTPQPYLLSGLIAICVSQLAAIGPSLRAAKLNIIEAIKHE